jgi:hypothetical protein
LRQGLGGKERSGAANAVAGMVLLCQFEFARGRIADCQASRRDGGARVRTRVTAREWLPLRDMGDEEVVACVGKFGRPILVERRLGFRCGSHAGRREADPGPEPGLTKFLKSFGKPRLAG